MNLGWKNRFLESRDAVIVQFRELAAILEEFSNQMEQAADVTASWEEMLSGYFAEAICAWTTCWCFNMKISRRRRFSHSAASMGDV